MGDSIADEIRAKKRVPDAYEADERWNAALDLAADIAAAREDALRAEVERLRGIVAAYEDGSLPDLTAVYMGATLDARREIERLRAERDKLAADLALARLERDDALSRLSRMCGDA